MTPVLIIYRWPDPHGTETRSGYKKAESALGNWWLVREKGLIGWIRGWDWLPVNGQFVTLQTVKEIQ